MDEHESFDAFRDFLRQKFLDIDHTQGSDLFFTRLAKLSLELADGVRKVESELKQARRKRAVQAAGASLSAVTAVLVAVKSNVFHDIPSILGGSGGAWGLISAMLNARIEVAKTEDQPFYFLWLLRRGSA